MLARPQQPSFDMGRTHIGTFFSMGTIAYSVKEIFTKKTGDEVGARKVFSTALPYFTLVMSATNLLMHTEWFRNLSDSSVVKRGAEYVAKPLSYLTAGFALMYSGFENPYKTVALFVLGKGVSSLGNRHYLKSHAEAELHDGKHNCLSCEVNAGMQIATNLGAGYVLRNLGQPQTEVNNNANQSSHAATQTTSGQAQAAVKAGTQVPTALPPAQQPRTAQDKIVEYLTSLISKSSKDEGKFTYKLYRHVQKNGHGRTTGHSQPVGDALDILNRGGEIEAQIQVVATPLVSQKVPANIPKRIFISGKNFTDDPVPVVASSVISSQAPVVSSSSSSSSASATSLVVSSVNVAQTQTRANLTPPATTANIVSGLRNFYPDFVNPSLSASSTNENLAVDRASKEKSKANAEGKAGEGAQAQAQVQVQANPQSQAPVATALRAEVVNADSVIREAALWCQIENAVNHYSSAALRVKHGVFAGALPRHLRDINEIISHVNQGTYSRKYGLACLVSASENIKPLHDLARACQALQVRVMPESAIARVNCVR